jgi:hypothetical protein
MVIRKTYFFALGGIREWIRYDTGVAPEPASVALMFEGLLAMVASRKLLRHHR